MKEKISLTCIITSLLFLFGCQTQNKGRLKVSGVLPETHLTYFGQDAPGLVPQKFAPEIISKSDRHEFGCTVSRDGTEFYFGVDNNGKMEIHKTILNDQKWGPQENIFPNDTFSHNDPMFALDDQRIYFISNRPLEPDNKSSDINIWYIEREKDHWSQPISLNTKINNHLDQYYSSFSSDGSLYFASRDTAHEAPKYAFDIYKSNFVEGDFQTPEKLPSEINSNRYEADVFVAPDESYMIFCSIRRNGLGNGDLYISFKDENDNWLDAVNMGEPINTEYHELCPYITPDGKYFFFTSNQDIYWVSSDILKEYKNKMK